MTTGSDISSALMPTTIATLRPGSGNRAPPIIAAVGISNST